MFYNYFFTYGHKFILQAIAIELRSESKWKQLGELALSIGKVY